MSIREDLFNQYRAYREKYKDTPNSKPNKIILNQEAYDELLATSKEKGETNLSMIFDDVYIDCEPEQEKAIKFEKRRFHK